MSIPRINYMQFRKARKLVHECCNYDGGNCIALDDGEICVCVKAFPIRCCASGSAPPSSRWTRRCMPRSWSAGTRNAVPGVENFSRRRSTTACIARPVQRSERGKAKGHGRGKSGGMCRKSSVQNPCKYWGFERRSAGWQGVYTFYP